MRSRLVLVLVCALTALAAVATPAFAAGSGHHSSTTTTTTTTHAGSHARHRHHMRTGRHGKTTSATKQKGVSESATAAGTSAKPTTGGSASIAVAKQILHECTSTGQITHRFTRAQLKKALSIMSASTSQYSNCSDAIHTALAHQVKLGGGTGSGGSGSSTTTIVIIIVVVLLLIAAIFGGLAVRRRRGDGGSGGGGVSPPRSS